MASLLAQLGSRYKFNNPRSNVMAIYSPRSPFPMPVTMTIAFLNVDGLPRVPPTISNISAGRGFPPYGLFKLPTALSRRPLYVTSASAGAAAARDDVAARARRVPAVLRPPLLPSERGILPRQRFAVGCDAGVRRRWRERAFYSVRWELWKLRVGRSTVFYSGRAVCESRVSW